MQLLFDRGLHFLRKQLHLKVWFQTISMYILQRAQNASPRSFSFLIKLPTKFPSTIAPTISFRFFFQTFIETFHDIVSLENLVRHICKHFFLHCHQFPLHEDSLDEFNLLTNQHTVYESLGLTNIWSEYVTRAVAEWD